jgi:hypothetical protein
MEVEMNLATDATATEIAEQLDYLKARAQCAVAILEKTARAAAVHYDAGADDECWMAVRSEVGALWTASGGALAELLAAYQEMAEVLQDVA